MDFEFLHLLLDLCGIVGLFSFFSKIFVVDEFEFLHLFENLFGILMFFLALLLVGEFRIFTSYNLVDIFSLFLSILNLFLTFLSVV